MLIQKCKKCSNQFTWKEVIRPIWFSWTYSPLKCPRCNTEHYINITTRLFIALGIVAPTAIKGFMFSRNAQTVLRISLRNQLLIYLLWFILLGCLTPFFARHHIEE